MMHVQTVAAGGPMQSWIHLLEHAALHHPDADAVRDDGGASYTYRQLLDRVERAAGGWAAAGIGADERVALIMQNSAEFLVQVLALSRAGALPVLVNWRLARTEVAQLMELFTPTAAVIDDDFVDGLQGVELGTVFGNTAGSDNSVAGLDGAPPPRPIRQLLGDAPFVIVHTSGTTGLPKGVPMTHRGTMSGALLTRSRGSSREPGQKHLRVMPMFHLAGLAGVLQALLAPDMVLIHRRFDPGEWLDAVEREGINYSNAGPSLIRRICDELERRPRDLSSLDELWYGTESMPPQVLDRAIQLIGCSFRQNYGMTEAQRPVSQLEPFDHTVDSPYLRSAGRIMPGFDVRIVDSDGHDVATGDPGEIWIRADTMFPGYWNNPDATATAFVGPAQPSGLAWYRTGDVGTLADNYLTIHDRINDMIVTGGENVYAAEVETVVRAYPGVKDVVVIGLASEQWGETVHAAIEPSGTGLEVDGLVNFCRQRLAHFKCPTGVTILDEIPRNATGKAMRRFVRDQLRASIETGSGPPHGNG